MASINGLRFARPHIESDSATVQGLLSYHLRERQISGFYATETCHPPDFRIPGHFHDHASMYFVLEGSLTEFYKDAKRDYVSTSVIFTPPGELHSNLFGNRGGRCFLLEIPNGYIDRLGAVGVRLETFLCANGGNLMWLGRRLYSEFTQPDSISSLSVDGLMLEALAEFGRLKTRSERVAPLWLRQSRDLIKDRFAERLTLDEIATTAGIHPAHLARSFRGYFGTSIGEYQRGLRLEYASKQLADTRTSILTIALAAGFADQAHMSRIFRNHTGLTPAKFRAQFGRDKQR